MAASSGKTKARRQTVGKGSRASGGGTRSARGEGPKASSEERAEKAAKSSLQRVTHITCSKSGSFQLRAEHNEPGEPYVEEWTLNFGDRGFVEASDEELDAVRKVLAGEWSDRRIGPKVFQNNARMVGLGIRTYGLEQPPIPSFDELSDDRAVRVAYDAGELRTADAVRAAIRYENESPERDPSREPRERVLKDLKDLLASLEGKEGSEAPPVPGPQQVGGAAPTLSLSAGAQELG